jgi:hypothetical protein
MKWIKPAKGSFKLRRSRFLSAGVSKRFVCLLAAYLLCAACAPAQTIEQSRDLSTSGLAYTNAVDSLVDSTVSRLIDFDSSVALKSRRGQSEAQLRMMLQTLNQDLTAIIDELEHFKDQNRLLAAYFLNLQALADSPVQQDFGGAVSELSGSISELNSTLNQNQRFELTPDQQASIGALAGLVGKSIQAAKIRKALERDASIIGTQLALQEQQLEVIAGILQDRFAAENDLFYHEKVEAPYADFAGQPDLGDQWRDDREQFIRSQFTYEQLQTAQTAAKQLRGIWTDILQGGNDIGSLKILISDVNEFVVAIENLKETSDSN